MNSSSESGQIAREWYTNPGLDDDVVVSTKVRLARNLADFPFPSSFKVDDASRIQTLVFDAFLNTPEKEYLNTLSTAGLSQNHAQVLIERGIISQDALKAPGTGIVMKLNGAQADSGFVCTVNHIDHIRISTFRTGLAFEEALAKCKETDDQLQKSLQFAASHDFGYLTTRLSDSGSGMKISARLHLPSIDLAGNIREVLSDVSSKGLEVVSAFGPGNATSTSLGNFYEISTKNSLNGSELEQLAFFTAAVKSLVETERKMSRMCLKNKLTQVQNSVLTAYGKVKFSLLLTLREAVSIISDLKWGKNMGIISGISDSVFISLLYRIQNAHLLTLVNSHGYEFPDDIKDNEEKQVERLRAIVLQDCLENMTISG